MSIMSMNELFYGGSEKVHIFKFVEPGSDSDGSPAADAHDSDTDSYHNYYRVLHNDEHLVWNGIPFYPASHPAFWNGIPFYPASHPASEAVSCSSDGSRTYEFRVPMCCGSCEDRVRSTLMLLKGVQSVDCNWRKKKATVKGTAAAADILLECRALFKKSAMWSDSD